MAIYPNDLIKDQLDQSEKLFYQISEFIQHFKNSPDPRIQSLVIVARRLKIFGCQQIKFFSSNLLQPSSEFPQEYIFSLLHDQIGRDFSIIREAACQRSHSGDLSRETLKTADYLGEAVFRSLNEVMTYKFVQRWPDFGDSSRIVQQDLASQESPRSEMSAQQASVPDLVMDKNKSRDWFRDHTDELKKIRPYLVLVGTGKQKLFPEQPVVITYFRKFPSIRLIPYANVALVGIPFTAVQRKKDLLATPHEIGHQVFWRWKELRGEIQNLSSVLPAYAERWAEEIFADTFGVQAVGAAAALYAQNLEAAFDRRHFQRDDGAHPTSVLRPYVHLKALNDENNPIVRELEELWTRYRESRTRRADHFEGHDGRPVEIDNAVGKGPVRQNYAHLKPTLPVDRLVELFLGKIPTGQVWSLQGSLDTLFSDFEAALGSLPFSQPLKEMDQAADITEINKLSDQSCSAIPLNDPTWYDVVRDYIEDDPAALLQTLPIPVNKWLPLMDMDAWADKGPTGNPRGD